jgi:hypothetical protein
MSGLPAGALNELLTNGPEAFDKAIADSQAQTQALMNQPKPPAPQSPEELNAIREGHILRALRENPGRTRAEVERAYDNEVRLAKNSYNEKIAAKAAAERAAAPKPQLYDTTEMSSEDIIKLAAIEVPRMPSQFEYDTDVLASFADYTLQEGISHRVANDLVKWWSDAVISAAGGDINWDEAERAFNETFSDLTDRQRAALASWMRSIHGVGDGQEEDEGA